MVLGHNLITKQKENGIEAHERVSLKCFISRLKRQDTCWETITQARMIHVAFLCP